MRQLASLFGRAKPRLIKPAGQYHETTRSILVLSHGVLPTTDIYLSPRLGGLRNRPVRYLDTSVKAPDVAGLEPGVHVIIVRYAPMPWLRFLYSNRSSLSGVALLIDDDIPGAIWCPDIPLRYALKLAYRYFKTARMLSAICDKVWVATPYLQKRYKESGPSLLTPLYLGAGERANSTSVTYFYHGTASHRIEMEFLVEVVRQVQSRCSYAHFEIIGGERTRQLFKGIPRVRVLHTMTWPDFLAYTSSVNYGVGLAPMLDTDFNRARSHNKLFDITRCGAAGVYSDMEVFRGHIRNGYNGVLCANDPTSWADRICLLLKDESKRDALYRNALSHCEAQASDPHFSLR